MTQTRDPAKVVTFCLRSLCQLSPKLFGLFGSLSIVNVQFVRSISLSQITDFKASPMENIREKCVKFPTINQP